MQITRFALSFSILQDCKCRIVLSFANADRKALQGFASEKLIETISKIHDTPTEQEQKRIETYWPPILAC